MRNEAEEIALFWREKYERLDAAHDALKGDIAALKEKLALAEAWLKAEEEYRTTLCTDKDFSKVDKAFNAFRKAIGDGK